jgi:hypothetical protein
MVLLHAEQRCNVFVALEQRSVNPLTVYIAELTVNTKSGLLFRGISSMRFQKTIAAFVATVGVSSSALGGNTDNYPRLGGVWNGGAQAYDSGFQTYAAKFHIVVIDGGWETWQRDRGYSKESVISSIKAQSKINSRVFQFVGCEEQLTTGSGSPTLVNKINSMNWWLYVVGTSGTKVTGVAGPPNVQVNMTAAAPKDPTTGLGPYQWAAKYVNDLYHLGLYNGTSAAPSLDGFFLDNVFWKPRVDGDWLRNGTTQSQTDATTQYNLRAGQKTFFDEMATIFPTGVFLGNNADWDGAGSGGVSPLGVLGGGILEGAIGDSWSAETWGGSAQLQQAYQYTINATTGAPKYLIVGHDYVTANGSDPYGPAWQAMRYGLAATLMNDGYYYANTNPNVYDDSASARLWFDEFDGGGRGVGYLGQPLSSTAGAVQTAAWSNGVWKREFANGIVLWNPKGNGQQTITLDKPYYRLKGNQDPAVNSGALISAGTPITLSDRDGLILMRLTPLKIPDPPTAVQIQTS